LFDRRDGLAAVPFLQRHVEAASGRCAAGGRARLPGAAIDFLRRLPSFGGDESQ
jgi:hypothetical protein